MCNRARRRRALRAARRTTPLAAGRRHSLPRTKLVRVVSRPPTTTPGSTSPLDPPRRTTSPRPAHRLTCADLVPRRARDHSLTTSCVLFTRPGEGSWVKGDVKGRMTQLHPSPFPDSCPCICPLTSLPSMYRCSHRPHERDAIVGLGASRLLCVEDQFANRFAWPRGARRLRL